jgi:hypothetical protein
MTGVLDFVYHPEFYMLENTTIPKLDVSETWRFIVLESQGGEQRP